jgi:PucR-like helix-turn-helix protein/diguanylate cyclase with GGDEF domain
LNELQELIDSLAAETGRLVGLDDTRFGALVYSAHPDDVDKVRRESILHREAPAEVTAWLEGLGIRGAEHAVRIPANDRYGMAARICTPVRWRGLLLGFVWAIDEPDPMVAHEIDATERCAASLGEALHRLRTEDTEQRKEERRLLRRLVGLSTEAGSNHEVRVELLARAEEYAVVVGELAAPERDGSFSESDTPLVRAFEQVRKKSSPHRMLIAPNGDQLVAVIAIDSPHELERWTRGLNEAAETALHEEEAGIAIGIGSPRPSPDQLAASFREATRAARASLAVPRLGSVAEWRRLGGYQPVASLLDGADPISAIPEPIWRLLNADESGALIGTLETYLDQACDAAAVAASLPLHRSSLYSRLHRIEELAQVDLRSGEDRLTLHLGLRLWRLAGSPRALNDRTRKVTV